jgi:hypothetical protein
MNEGAKPMNDKPTVRIPAYGHTARLADLAKPVKGRVEYVAKCRRCGGKGGCDAWPGFVCYECGGQCHVLYSHAEWVFPTAWTDEQVAEFLAGKEAARAARAEAKRLKMVAEAQAARDAQSPEFAAVWARWQAGEFAGKREYGFVDSMLSRTLVLEPITTAQAEAVVKAVADAETRLAAKAASRWVGEVGSKVTVAGTVVFTKTVESAYGTSVLVVVDADGDKVTTFTTAAWAWDAAKGDTVTLTGTVKSHETYEGEQRTVLTRTKCAEFDAARKARDERRLARVGAGDEDMI